MTELESRYSNLFRISTLTLPYVVLSGGWEKQSNEYGIGAIDCNTVSEPYQLPEDFQANDPSTFFTDEKCRLLRYDCNIIRSGLSRLSFTFSKIEYLDYLRSGEFLDAPLPDDPSRTFRDKYAPRLDIANLTHSRLSNICGVGIFILTRDNKILVSKHTRNVKVYADTWSFSASGTMDWSDNVNPFHDVARECWEEIGHRINFDDTYLFGFGVDAKKLFFAFSFFETTGRSSQEIMAKAPQARDNSAEIEEIEALPFELDAVVDAVKNRKWEPAAAAGLLTLCTKKFRHSKVEREVDSAFVRRRVRKELEAEWDNRATRPSDLAVMSARYPTHRIKDESQKYVKAVLDFIGDDVDQKEVLEIGAGIGRLSEFLVNKARELTCLDLSGKMLEQNRARLGPLAQRVRYVKMYGQDFRPEKAYGVVISSLVLIHNVDESDFRSIVEVMKESGRTIFIFEHIDVGSQVSQYTRLRGEAELLTAFSGYEMERRREYQLFTDNLIFLKLVR